MDSIHALQICIALISVFLFFYHFPNQRHRIPLPPGPYPLPLIGNVRDLPPPGRAEYLHWLKFKNDYGSLSSITILGKPMIIIHDKIAADVILEKSSLKTSGRPTQPFADACGFNEMLPGRQYNAESKRHRKYVHQQLGTMRAASRFNFVQDVESRRLLFRVLTDPDNLMEHFKKEASAIILRITYGYAPEPHGTDPLVSLVEQMMDNFSNAFVPLSWAVDIFPQLRYLPEGFPGSGFKKVARDWNRLTRAASRVPYSFTKRQMAAGANRPSYVSSLIKKFSDSSSHEVLSKGDENMIEQTSAILYGAAADTTISTLSSFVLAMVLFPDVQRKAQEEVDKVVGTTRLPRFEDRERLPYINALVKESLRWFTIVPIGTTHVADEEVIYEGFRIPKGSYLLPCIWWFLHDPDVYPNPSSFDPERFIEPRDEPDPTKHAFGYGRRICPGRFLAIDSLFITISRFVAAFDVSRAVDDEGRELEIQVEPTAGLISRPASYPYVIKARSPEHVNLIRSVEKEHPWEISDAQLLNLEGIEI